MLQVICMEAWYRIAIQISLRPPRSTLRQKYSGHPFVPNTDTVAMRNYTTRFPDMGVLNKGVRKLLRLSHLRRSQAASSTVAANRATNSWNSGRRSKPS